MSEIIVVHNPDAAELEQQGVFNWPIWEKEVSAFPWTYGDRETCYLLQGEVTVTPKGDFPVLPGGEHGGGVELGLIHGIPPMVDPGGPPR